MARRHPTGRYAARCRLCHSLDLDHAATLAFGADISSNRTLAGNSPCARRTPRRGAAREQVDLLLEARGTGAVLGTDRAIDRCAADPDADLHPATGAVIDGRGGHREQRRGPARDRGHQGPDRRRGRGHGQGAEQRPGLEGDQGWVLAGHVARHPQAVEPHLLAPPHALDNVAHRCGPEVQQAEPEPASGCRGPGRHADTLRTCGRHRDRATRLDAPLQDQDGVEGSPRQLSHRRGNDAPVSGDPSRDGNDAVRLTLGAAWATGGQPGRPTSRTWVDSAALDRAGPTGEKLGSGLGIAAGWRSRVRGKNLAKGRRELITLAPVPYSPPRKPPWGLGKNGRRRRAAKAWSAGASYSRAGSRATVSGPAAPR
jgi:hypothetical protein